jgi:acetate kinase
MEQITRLLVFNAGSSSLKFALFDEKFHALTRGVIRWSADGAADFSVENGAPSQKNESIGKIGYRDAVRHVQKTLLDQKLVHHVEEVSAIGQRVVHGGTRFTAPTRITQDVIAEIEDLSEIAPLHNPPALQCIRGVSEFFPGAPQFAVFDTAYFQTLAPEQYVYPLPYEWYRDWGLRRFGFHGISHSDCAFRAAELLSRIDLRVVSCHLGQGASVTASHGQKAVATTMGFTPLEGLMMGSRSGSVDPGLLLYAQRKRGLTAEKLEEVLNHQAGLKGVSGLSGDFREIEQAASSGQEQCRLALSMFVDRARAAIGAMAVTLGGVDALIFTGGIGENAVDVRRRITQGLECLGLELDVSKNTTAKPDAEVASAASKGKIFVLRAEEETAIAQEAGKLLSPNRVA